MVCSSYLPAQIGHYLSLQEFPLYITYDPSKVDDSEMMKNYSSLLSMDKTEFDSIMNWQHKLKLFNYGIYLQEHNLNDSITNYNLKLYLHEAYEIMPRQTCGVLRTMKEATNSKTFTWSEYPFFLNYLDDFDQDSFFLACKVHYPPKTESTTNRDTTSSAIFRLIHSRDQDIRKVDDVEYEKMKILDSLNRRDIDSLWRERGASFSGFTAMEQDVIGLVLHHSTDLDWNLLWIDRFLQARLDKTCRGGQAFSAAIDRHLHPLRGVHRYTDAVKIKYFVEYLKCKYPEEFAKKYGYYQY